MIKKGLMRDKLYVPIKYIDRSLYNNLLINFTKEIEVFVPPSLCESCYREHEDDPPCEEQIKSCPYKTLQLRMFDKLRRSNGNYISVWRGNLPLVKKIFKGFKVKDRRSYERAEHTLEFTGKLKKYQVEAALNWVRGRAGGQIEAPARSGKTVIGCYLACKLKLKTLILAHQIDLLDQFFSTFQSFTNLDKKKSNVAIAEKGNIVELVNSGMDIILSTYQTFISKKGLKRLDYVRNRFGFIVADESHTFGADRSSNILSSFNPALFLGLTATPDRKDGRDILAKFALGDVVSRVTPPQLSGKAIMIHTGTNVGQWSNWVTMINRLSVNARRNKIIINYAVKDLEAGHKLILVTDRVKQCKALVEMLREKGIKAEALHGTINKRKDLIDRIRSGKVPVTVATRKLVKFGLNIPPWSAYFCLSPTNNPPNFYQEMSRIRTPFPGKKKPLVRYFVDSFAAAWSCAKTCERVLREQKFEVIRESISNDISKAIRKKADKKTQDAISRWNTLLKN